MTDRDGINSDTPLQDARARRPRLAILAGAAGACLAAAAIATGSVVTAAPASADFDDLVDPIIQPLLTHVADSFSGIDTAFGADVTAWADHALAHLGSLDSAAALSSTAATADSTTTTSEAATGTAYIPITVQEDTEPSIQATVNGSDTSLLVDTGSGGLVIPWQDLGSSHWEVLRELHQAGAHLEKFGHSGYSGGVQYSYREYDGLTVDYGNGQLITTNTPVDIVWNSHGVFGSGGPRNFEEFLRHVGVVRGRLFCGRWWGHDCARAWRNADLKSWRNPTGISDLRIKALQIRCRRDIQSGGHLCKRVFAYANSCGTKICVLIAPFCRSDATINSHILQLPFYELQIADLNHRYRF